MQSMKVGISWSFNSILIFFFLLGLTRANAQEVKKFKFGLMAAPNIHWMNPSSKGVESQGTRFQFDYGLLTDFSLKGNNNYYIASGVRIINNGGILEYPDVFSENGNRYAARTKSIYSLRYVEVPLGLKMRTKEIGYSIFAGHFALGTGFRVKATRKSDIAYLDAGNLRERSVEEDFMDGTNLMRFALILGLEWERKISGDTFFTFGLNFSNGFSDVLKGRAYEADGNGRGNGNAVGNDGGPEGPELRANSKQLTFHLGVYF